MRMDPPYITSIAWNLWQPLTASVWNAADTQTSVVALELDWRMDATCRLQASLVPLSLSNEESGGRRGQQLSLL